MNENEETIFQKYILMKQGFDQLYEPVINHREVSLNTMIPLSKDNNVDQSL